MNHQDCGIIRDLLPRYHDNACHAQSREAIEEHLKTCEDCRAEWETIKAQPPAGRQKESVFRRGKRWVSTYPFWTALLIVLFIVLAAFILIPLSVALTPADSTASMKTVYAAAYPGEAVLEIPMRTRADTYQFELYAGLTFSSGKSFVEIQRELEANEAIDAVEGYYTIRSILVLRRENDNETTDFYAFQMGDSQGKKGQFILSGMRAAVLRDSGSAVTIALPLHLVSDARVINRLDVQLAAGAEYECDALKDEANNDLGDALPLFRQFYEDTGWYTVEETGTSLIVSPKESLEGAPAFQITFTTHAGKTFFMVSLS